MSGSSYIYLSFTVRSPEHISCYPFRSYTYNRINLGYTNNSIQQRLSWHFLSKTFSRTSKLFQALFWIEIFGKARKVCFHRIKQKWSGRRKGKRKNKDCILKHTDGAETSNEILNLIKITEPLPSWSIPSFSRKCSVLLTPLQLKLVGDLCDSWNLWRGINSTVFT